MEKFLKFFYGPPEKNGNPNSRGSSDPVNTLPPDRQYIDVPVRPYYSPFVIFFHRIVGIALQPLNLALAVILRTPGMAMHIRISFLGLRLFLRGRLPLKKAGPLIFSPMDSTRYFEFHEVWKSLCQETRTRYLDISSPRQVPVLFLLKNTGTHADLMNPDPNDLMETEQLAAACGLSDRCRFSSTPLENTPYPPESFDLITCLSVLEHIPEDEAAIRKIWSLLCPGGRFILTVPCMRRPADQYISRNDYGLLSPGPDGYTFWQRFYDEKRLRDVIFSVTGRPSKTRVYGEKTPGSFLRNAGQKRLLGPKYPFWREALMMGMEYKYFKTIADLPGEGVIMLEFIKP